MWTVIEPAALFNVSLLPLKPPTDILAGFPSPAFVLSASTVLIQAQVRGEGA